MSDQCEQSRPVKAMDGSKRRAKRYQQTQSKRSINHEKYASKAIDELSNRLRGWSIFHKHDKPIRLTDQTLYVFSYYRPLTVIASTNSSNPEFTVKVSPNVIKALRQDLIGYGPLLLIRYKETVPCGKSERDNYEIIQDFQPNYEHERESIENYKKEQAEKKEAAKRKRRETLTKKEII